MYNNTLLAHSLTHYLSNTKDDGGCDIGDGTWPIVEYSSLGSGPVHDFSTGSASLRSNQDPAVVIEDITKGESTLGADVCICVYVYMYAQICENFLVCMYMYSVCMCMKICIYVYVCMKCAFPFILFSSVIVFLSPFIYVCMYVCNCNHITRLCMYTLHISQKGYSKTGWALVYLGCVAVVSTVFCNIYWWKDKKDHLKAQREVFNSNRRGRV